MGLGYAEHYVSNGWRVVATATSPEPTESLDRLRAANEAAILYQPLDVTQATSVSALANRLASLRIELDLAINNAGLSLAEPFGDWSSETFLRHLLANAVGPALVASALTPLMKRHSKLVNITSGMGSLGLNIDPAGDLTAYATSKAALNQLTRRLAALLRPRGVMVVAINPGWVRTEMGGPDATTSVEDAVEEITATIRDLTEDQSGALLERDGSPMPF